MKEKMNVKNTKHANVRLPIELYEEIEKFAEESERKPSEQIRYMLKEYIKIKKS